jgi:phosphoglycolate phosphatase-like HAD superfamily hydrolase
MRVRHQASEKYGAAVEKVPAVYVADAERDIEAAALGGARCLAVATGRATVADLRDAGADLVLTDLSDTGQVLTAIDRLTKVPVRR